MKHTAMGLLGAVMFVWVVPPAPGWVLAFSDEFNGAALDTEKWYTLTAWGNRQHGAVGEQELQAYVAWGETDVTSPFSFAKDGDVRYLRIAARQNATALPRSPNGDDYSGARTPAYTSGILNTCFYDRGSRCGPKSFVQLGGYFEMRARMPSAGPGMWPAFWTYRPLPLNTAEPYEMDILEFQGGRPDRYYVSYHRTGLDAEMIKPNGGNLSSGFHAYAADWDPGTGDIVFYFDGRPVARSSGENEAPMFVMANLAISSGSWGAAPGHSTMFPGYLDIDYIRVYRKSPGGGYSKIPGPTPIPASGG